MRVRQPGSGEPSSRRGNASCPCACSSLADASSRTRCLVSRALSKAGMDWPPQRQLDSQAPYPGAQSPPDTSLARLGPRSLRHPGVPLFLNQLLDQARVQMLEMREHRIRDRLVGEEVLGGAGGLTLLIPSGADVVAAHLVLAGPGGGTNAAPQLPHLSNPPRRCPLVIAPSGRPVSWPLVARTPDHRAPVLTSCACVCSHVSSDTIRRASSCRTNSVALLGGGEIIKPPLAEQEDAHRYILLSRRRVFLVLALDVDARQSTAVARHGREDRPLAKGTDRIGLVHGCSGKRNRRQMPRDVTPECVRQKPRWKATSG